MVKLLPIWALSSSVFAVALAAPISGPRIHTPVNDPASPFISTPYNECGKGPGYPIGCPPGTPVIESISAPPPEPDSIEPDSPPPCGPSPGLPMCLDTTTADLSGPAPPPSSSTTTNPLTPRAKDPIKYSECVSDAMIALHVWRRSCLATSVDVLTPPWCRLTAPSPKSCCIDETMAYTCKLFRPVDNPEWREKTCDKGSELYEPEWCAFIDPIEETCKEDAGRCLDMDK